MWPSRSCVDRPLTSIYPNFNRYCRIFFVCLPLVFADGRVEPIVRLNKFEYQHGGVAAEHSCVLRCGNAKSIALTPDALVLA